MKKISVLILAAGKASRFGSEKLLQKLPDGKPIIRHITDTVLETGLSPVIIVTPKDDHLLRAVLQDCDVSYASNPFSHLGISTSLQMGIRNVPQDSDACMVILGDQPFISKQLLLLLADEYSSSQAEIIYPAVEGTRSNPVILDRSTFTAIMQLHGDIGARAIFPNFKNHAVSWPDSRLLLDVDSPEDFQHIIDEWLDRHS